MKRIATAIAAALIATSAQAASVDVKVPAKKIEQAILQNCKGEVKSDGRIITCRTEASRFDDFLMAFSQTGAYGSTTEQIIQIVLTPIKGGTRMNAIVWLEGYNGMGAKFRTVISDDKVQAELEKEVFGKQK